MKNILLTALFLLPFMMISCQKEAVNNSANAVKITGQVVSDKSLKTAFINPTVNWLANVDHIGVYSNRAYVTAPGDLATNVDYVAQSTATSSTFSSTTPIYWDGTLTEHDFGAYYPYVAGTFPYTAVPISLPAAQTQAGATTDHIGPLDFEVATPIGLLPEPGNNPPLYFEFNHVFTILKFDLTCGEANSLASISLTTSAAPNISLNTGSTIDISPYPLPAFYSINAASGGTPLNVTLTLSPTLPISTTVASAYMLILPGDHSANNFTIVYTASITGKTYTVNNKAGKVFERGKVYTITQDIPVGGGGW